MKKIITIIVSILVVLGIGVGVLYFFTKEDSDSTLTILEKQWIEDNKNTVQDFSVVNKVPVFTLDGEGVVYDFLADLEEKTGLEFNKLTYNYDAKKSSDYSFTLKDKLDDKDILVYQDNYVLISKISDKKVSIKDIKGKKIGVLDKERDKVEFYLNNDTLTFTTYESVDDLLDEFERKTTELDYIVLPKTMYLNTILSKNYVICYNISEMTKSYVITLGNNDTLNKIITKYFNKWHDMSYDESFNNHFTKSYFALADISSDAEVNFHSKRYVYGFVDNAPYDKLINKKLIGINNEIISKFASLSNVEITYREYKTYQDLFNAFNNGKVDFFMSAADNVKYTVDTFETIDIFNSDVVILSNINNNVVINSLNSLNEKTVAVLSNTRISEYLSSKKINTKEYNSLNKLIKKNNNDTLLAVDYLTYDTYKNTSLNDYRIAYQFSLDNDYSYILKDKDNDIFNNYYNFYLSFINEQEAINNISYNDFKVEESSRILKNLIYILSAVLALLVITVAFKMFKLNKKKKQGITKENKLKYIDMLTSLKNRTYLNDHIEEWDDSGVYPQSIMIVDLNNVAYINDNYGHEEGDNVITEAANILIKNQVEQTEIIRTSGNEFLIYLVGYDEKQIVAYKRKLIKEFKELAHGFGAAVGYSMILDGLKTIDYAINEAALDMRANKEETE